MRSLLLLSKTTGYQLRAFGEAADDLGVSIRFATDRCHALDDPWRDGAVPVRFHEEEASLAAIRGAAAETPIAGVLAVGDRPVVLAARAAAALALPGNPPDAARASAHKRLARERFARAGLPSPRFAPVTLDDGVRHLAGVLPYPVVIKPVGLSGSRGVIRANTPDELSAAFDRVSTLLQRPEIRAMRTGMDEQLLIETFVEGKEYAVEGLLTAGVFRPLAVFEKPDPLDGPFFEETIYLTPPAGGTALEAAIVAAVARAVAALGLRHGPVHAECRVNGRGVFVLEVAARPIGGLCSRILRFVDGGRTVSLEHVLLRHALGEDVAAVRREAHAAAVMMIPIPQRGVFKRADGEDRARAVPGVEDVRITAKAGQLLEPLPEAGSYLGFIFARAGEPAGAEHALREAHRRLVFTVDRVGGALRAGGG